MNESWNRLSSIEDLEQADKLSFEMPVMLFKHSTRCSISSMALNRLLRSKLAENQEKNIFYLDLIAHRNVSNEISAKYQVYHESPQALVIRNGECVYDASHSEIDASDILSALQN